ncbi:hypothetical protein FPZ12_030925 [Amycolatopsis acidicola]|uniref:PPE domain-containing protein n=1 Tax=Amycolatopsis acidicola TaxID=2596893 RepID=A0A5N0USM6_9PSEU|nr:hypothetical protein [Amycolatopsis acidicola]KAA9154941.1 hypothetical protein FPZ12_030925 [Amycolatopsis acidicola]
MGNQSESPQSAPSSVRLGDNGESAAIVQQARNSAGGFDYGSDRAIASPPNWASQESTQLYQGATVNNDPATAEATGQLWGSHGDELHQAANDLYNAVSELGNAWVGKGASSAQGALVGIANSSQQAGDAAHTMSSRMAQQAVAAAEVKKMPQPKEFDPAKQTAAMLAGGPAAMVTDMKQQSDEAKAVHAQQVQYFNAYTQAMSDVDDSTPSFGPESLGLPADGSIGSTKASSVGANTGGTVGVLGGVSGGPALGANGGADGFGGGNRSQLGQIGEAGQVGAPGAQGAPAAPPAPAAGTAAPASTGASAVPTSSSGGGGSSAALAAGLGLAGGGLGVGGLKAALGRGSKSGAKKDGDSTAAASTDGAEQQGHGAAQNQGVMSANGTIGGSNTTAATPGMGGMGAGGAHGGEEDQEHNRASFLIEADPDEAFGANVATAPPVIGAWSDEDED